MAYQLFLWLVVMVCCCDVGLAQDPSPLQDICVANLNSTVLVNGFACKDPKLVNADDFSFSGLHLVGNISNAFGHSLTLVNILAVPGLNTLGITMNRNDFALWGVNPPHIHHRASEIIIVLEGTLEVGFITTNPENRLVSEIIQKGDVFVFPKGLVHFNRNVGSSNAVALVFFSGQSGSGTVDIASTIFGSKPALSSDLLARSLQVDEDTISTIPTIF